jgi:hypothetical protein
MKRRPAALGRQRVEFRAHRGIGLRQVVEPCVSAL